MHDPNCYREELKYRAGQQGRSIWGVQLYASDISLVVRVETEELLNQNIPVEVITKKLERLVDDEAVPVDEIVYFWLALADTQWKNGVLKQEVREKAQKILASGADLDFWEKHFPARAQKRKQILDKLAEELEQPPPYPKKRRSFICEWKTGDVFALPVDSILDKQINMENRYFLIRKVDEGAWHPYHVVPIVHVKLTDGSSVPLSCEDYERAEYIQIRYTLYEDRLFPFEPNHPNWADILAVRKNKVYETDEKGFLPQYRLKLIITSKTQMPKKLHFIGNYPNVSLPSREYVPYTEWNLSSVLWKDFQARMLEAYFDYNKRQSPAYR